MAYVQGFIVPVPKARFDDWKNRLPFDGKRMIWGGFVPFLGMNSGQEGAR